VDESCVGEWNLNWYGAVVTDMATGVKPMAALDCADPNLYVFLVRGVLIRPSSISVSCKLAVAATQPTGLGADAHGRALLGSGEFPWAMCAARARR
jgi:hypothetical protein